MKIIDAQVHIWGQTVSPPTGKHRKVSQVTAEQMLTEMDEAGVDWQFVNFSGAVHCFALPEANKPPGCVYNELAMRRGERMMRVFFAERFGHALARDAGK